MRETGIFSDDRSLIIFAVTILVLCLIVFSLIRWVLHLQTFGSLLHTTRDVEDITTECFRDRLETPCLGAKPLKGDVPDDAEAILARESGYIQRIYVEALNAAAEEAKVEIFLPEPVGSFVFTGAPIAFVKGKVSGESKEDFIDSVHDGIEVDDLRVYDQDPRFGLIVMGEIASKALSPGINDPGTAIDIITRVGRILSYYRDEVDAEEEVDYPHVHIPPLSPDDLIEDAFSTVARDGAEVVEVQVILQKVLAGLMRHPDDKLCDAAAAFSDRVRGWAEQSLKFEGEQDRLDRAIAKDRDSPKG